MLEFNVRLGDPETQAILPRLPNGLFTELCLHIAHGTLESFKIEFDPKPVCAVVLAANGYPESPIKGDPITWDESLESSDRWLIHAGTTIKDNTLRTNGGRVATVVSRGISAQDAQLLTYEGVRLISFNKSHYRTDIGDTKIK